MLRSRDTLPATVVAALLLAVLPACGGSEERSAVPAAETSPLWRIAKSRAGETGFHVHCRAPCRVRFRVEGAEALLHT